jgi:AcrR family transcriptional regulator
MSFYERFLKKKPQQSRSRSMVDAILVSALERIADARSDEDEDGGVSVHDVAARAGVGIGSLYDYFRDRGSLLSAAAAKVAQDNLDAFHALLAETSALPLRKAIESVMDFALQTYTADPQKIRVIVRLTARLNLLTMLARSQTLFAASLAEAMKRRSDVHVADIDSASWIVTQALMGVIMALVWADEPPDRQAIRDATVEMFVGYLGGNRTTAPVNVAKTT